MPATFRPLLAAASLVAVFAACDDPYAIKAQYPVVTDTTMLYSINSAPVGAPTAYLLLGAPSGGAAVVANTGFTFDVAVDVTAEGGVRLHTPRSLVGVIPDPSQPPHRVGLQVVSTPFAQLTLAPASGYAYDSLLTVTPGQTVVIQSANPNGCPPVSYLGTVFYAKMVVDSVLTGPERVFLRAVVDPNCDFRSLAPGVPEE